VPRVLLLLLVDRREVLLGSLNGIGSKFRVIQEVPVSIHLLLNPMILDNVGHVLVVGLLVEHV